MPYRRLPNTDKARLRTLLSAVEKGGGNGVISRDNYLRAKQFLPRFRSVVDGYDRCVKQMESKRNNENYFAAYKTAKMYLSHFIQVLNMCIIRKEIKNSLKELYGLPKDSYSVPDITSEAALIDYGEKVIRGEEMRMQRGGIPIYNPTIAKVKVHYDIFRDLYEQQLLKFRTIERAQQAVVALRPEGDAIILDIWNEVEAYFQDLEGDVRLERCREYGVIYYYRPSEQKEADGHC